MYVSSGGLVSDTTLRSGGVATIYAGGHANLTYVSSGSVLEFFGAGVASNTIVASGGTVYAASGGVVVGTTVSSGGNEYVYSGGVASNTTVASGGAEKVGAGGTASGTVVSSGGTEIISSGGTAVGTVVSSGGTEIISSGGVTSNTTLVSGGKIDVKSLAFTSSGTVSWNSSTHTLTVTEGGNVYTQVLSGSYTASDFVLTSDGSGGTDIAFLCFYPGTRIATPAGETAVEDLCVGDMVLTANGQLPVRWLGQSHVHTRLVDPLRSLPIRIKASALGEALPVHDLLLSPDHAVFIDGILVQAGALVNNTSIVREYDVPEQFTYYHVELATHELLLAEGVQTESFVDNVDRMNFHNWDERSTPVEPIEEMPHPRAKSYRQLPTALKARLAMRGATSKSWVA